MNAALLDRMVRWNLDLDGDSYGDERERQVEPPGAGGEREGERARRAGGTQGGHEAAFNLGSRSV